MADIRTSSMGGVPKGTTSNRPSNPSVGDVYYNGTLGCLEIYTSQGWVANSAPPGIPDIGTSTYSATNQSYNNASASVVFTPGQGGGLPNSYRATSNPGGFTGTASSSPITVSGLQSGTSYTFSVTGTNNFGTSAASISSNSITANTVPQAPTVGTLSFLSTTSLSLTFTAGATGGSSITNYKYSTDGVNYTAFSPAQTTSPLTISGLSPTTSYSFYLKAVNSNGDSAASSVSNSVVTGSSVTGGILSSDSTYYYRTFASTGSLSISGATLNADVLTLAGGGSGGAQVGGGGGAGGLLYNSNQSLSTGSYTVTIGAGGSYPSGYSQNGGPENKGNKGVDSSFTNGASITFTATGGGGGSGYSNQAGPNGGSGGGADGQGQSNYGAGTSGQGNRGGTGYSGSWAGGGGGGAGAVGGNASANTGGDGGNGTNSYSSWLTAITSSMSGSSGWATATSGGYIAGGGGGCNTNTSSGRVGNGGAGGGASGASDTVTGGVAVINTGSGGGGSRDQRPPTSGSSGLVIVRYTKSQVGG